MPHIELRTSTDVAQRLDVPKLLMELTQRLSGFETVSPSAIKAYHIPVREWVMGAGAPSGFVHCQVSVLAGRPLELRKRMADELVGVIRSAASSIPSGDVAVSLELREMEPDTYRK